MAQTRYERAAIVYNPAAGRSAFRREKPVEAIAGALGQHVSEVLLLPTTTERRAGEMSRQALDQGCDLIAPLGGDGTINEAVQVVANTSSALLPLPGGTANVLARETGLGLDPVLTAKSLPRLEAQSVELGSVQFTGDQPPRLFLLMCGAGVDANAVYELNTTLKRQVGILAYIWSGLRQMLRRQVEMEVQLEAESITAGMVVVSKSRLYGGGLTLTPEAHLLAEQFDVVCFPAHPTVVYPWYLAAVLTRSIDRVSEIIHRQVSAIDIRTESGRSVPVQIDGELVGRLPVQVRMGPHRVRLLAPTEYWTRLG